MELTSWSGIGIVPDLSPLLVPSVTVLGNDYWQDVSSADISLSTFVPGTLIGGLAVSITRLTWFGHHMSHMMESGCEPATVPVSRKTCMYPRTFHVPFLVGYVYATGSCRDTLGIDKTILPTWQGLNFQG